MRILRDPRRVLITVLASASAQLPKLVKEANVEEHLMLVADECHRAGANEMSKVFKAKRRWSLGLSATPEREDDDDAGYDKSLLGKSSGQSFTNSTVRRSGEGLVPKFTIHHYGLNMTAEERLRYRGVVPFHHRSMSQLKAQRDAGSDGDFFSWARSIASRNQGELGAIAMRFVSDASKRRELLNHMAARHEAVVELIRQEFRIIPTPASSCSTRASARLKTCSPISMRSSLPAIMEHSELPDSMQRDGPDTFAEGLRGSSSPRDR